MKCTHSEAEKDTELADGACPLCLAAELAAYQARVEMLEKIIEDARNGNYDNAHEINAIRTFLYNAMEKYRAALAEKVTQ